MDRKLNIFSNLYASVKAGNPPSWLFLLSFIALSVGLRFLSFQYSVIDHDESTYTVIAQELLLGKQYYVDVWDTKPIGIFLVFAGTLKVFGNSILAIRFMAALAIGLTAYFLFCAAKRWGHPTLNASIAGFAYLMMCSMHKWNFAANTEIFFNLFTAIGLFFFLGKRSNRSFFLTGLAIGLGFVIKYFVLFDLFAFWLFYLLIREKDPVAAPLLKIAKRTLSMGIGFILPFATVFLYYFSGAHFDAFLYTTFVVPGQYAASFDYLKALNFILEIHLIYAPFVLIFYAIILGKKQNNLTRLGSLWIALVWVIILLPGKFFQHYAFQLLPPISFVIAGLPISESALAKYIMRHKTTIAATLLPVFLIWNIYLQRNLFVQRPDHRREVSEYLKKRLQEKDIIHCNHSSIIYFLLQKSPIEKYIHPTLLSKPEHIQAIGVDVEKEIQKIIRERPAFVILEDPVSPTLKAYVDTECQFEQSFGDRISLYRRKQDK